MSWSCILKAELIFQLYSLGTNFRDRAAFSWLMPSALASVVLSSFSLMLFFTLFEIEVLWFTTTCEVLHALQDCEFLLAFLCFFLSSLTISEDITLIMLCYLVLTKNSMELRGKHRLDIEFDYLEFISIIEKNRNKVKVSLPHRNHHNNLFNISWKMTNKIWSGTASWCFTRWIYLICLRIFQKALLISTQIFAGKKIQ